MRNQEVSVEEMAHIRSLAHFDLTMLISEINDHGWAVARQTLAIMPKSGADQPLSNPTHKPYMQEPGGKITVYETKPIGPEQGFEGTCKYCRRTHSAWWCMPDEEYVSAIAGEDNRALLCGYCEHVSLARNM